LVLFVGFLLESLIVSVLKPVDCMYSFCYVYDVVTVLAVMELYTSSLTPV